MLGLELTGKQAPKDLATGALLVSPYLFCQRMGLCIRIFEALGGDVGVDPGGAQVFVAEEFLDAA